MNNTFNDGSLQASQILELSLKDKFLYNRITTDILRAAGYGTSKGATLIRMLLEDYVQSNSYCESGVYPATREVLAERLQTTVENIRQILHRIDARQTETQITLLTWTVEHYKDDRNRWRTQPTSFNLSPILAVWIEIESQFRTHPASEADQYRAVWETAKVLVGQLAWEKRQPKPDRSFESRISEDVKRTVNNAARTKILENFQSYRHRFLEEFNKAADEAEKHLGSILD